MTTVTEELLFVPLGGTGEIGMNLNVYGCRGGWLVVDMGVSFGDDSTPGVELFMADPAFLVERRKDVLGLVLTHAHEDHLGAVAHLWDRLRCPIYASPFAAQLLKGKLREAGLQDRATVKVISPGQTVTLGAFTVEPIHVTHSIPEPSSLALHTPFGTVLHTGDWKFDPQPLIGDVADQKRLKALGDAGITALVGDSTNVFTPGISGSEADVRESLIGLLGKYKRKIAVACFATNVTRVESIAKAAHANRRSVALVGRSLWRIDEAARQCGYFQDLPPFLTEQEAAAVAPEHIVYLCTGSQGEPRAALARIAQQNHPHLSLGPGDVCIFSSRIIPGNEKAIFQVQNHLARSGVEIVTEKDHFVHVSGHPGRVELAKMLELTRPKLVIPVHGERRHLDAHAELAEDEGVPQSLVIENGTVVRIAPGPAEIVDHVPTGRLALDGVRLVPWDSPIMRSRGKVVHNGSAVVTLVVDRKGAMLGEPQVSAHGLLDPEHETEEHDAVVEAVREAFGGLAHLARLNDEVVRETVRLAVRRHLKSSHGKKPLTDVHLVRI